MTDISDDEKKWFEVVEQGNVGEVMQMIEEGMDVHVVNDVNQTDAFTVACKKGNLDLAQILLDAGSWLNGNGTIDPALMIASREGNMDVFSWLMEKKAEVDARNGKEETALITASRKGHTGIATLLVENGADVNAQGIDQIPPLFLASYLGHSEIAKLLVDNGAFVDGLCLEGTNVWKVNGDLWVHGNETALIAASSKGHTGIARMLIEHGADVNAWENFSRKTPLINAALNGHTETVKLLLESGADMDRQGKWRETPLRLASERGFTEIARLLVENGADVDVESTKGSALDLAVQNSHQDIVRLLINHGAKGNNDDGMTWCETDHWSYRRGFRDAVKEVLLMWNHDQYDDDELNGFEWNMLPREVIDVIIGELAALSRPNWDKVEREKREREEDEEDEEKESEQPNRKKRREQEMNG